MFFMHELIDALKNAALQLECPEMEVAQEGIARPQVISGPGYIGQQSDGTLVFKLFSSAASFEHTDPYKDLTPGQLLPSTHYYSLRATDKHGRQWTARRIRTDIHSGQIKDGRHAVVCSGLVRDIEYVDQDAGKARGNQLSICFFEEIDLPYNQATITEKRVGERVSRSFCRNVAVFPAAGFDCRVTMEDGTTTFVIETDDRLPPWVEVRVIEAFQFILARTVWSRVIRIYDAGSEVIRFTSSLGPAGKPRMARPIQQNTEEELTWTWALFDKYLAYILPFHGEGWHPCSRHLHAVSMASVSSVHSEALVLCVAVEGICNEVFDHLCEPTFDFLSAVNSLQQYAKAWPGSGSKEDTAKVRNRLPGLFGMLTQSRALDRLYLLADRGWIDRDLIAAWKALRPKTAHGSTPEVRVSQDFLDQRQQVTDLLYQLVFCAIGYEGKYIIRTPRAWRPREYPSPEFWASRVDAIHLNAYYRWINRGAPHGNDLDDWLAAEREILDAEWQRVRPNHHTSVDRVTAGALSTG